jgi:phospholipid-binding lipoprotein MlaA
MTGHRVKTGRKTRLAGPWLVSVLLCVLLAGGCAHQPPASPRAVPRESAPVAVPPPPAAATPAPEQSPPGPSALPAGPEKDGIEADAYIDTGEEEAKQKPPTIADPLEPFNRAMYHFNDKLYFWLLKPVAQGYEKVVPEVARIGVKNFFTNLAFPIRFVNALLQADFGGATTELGRFLLNTACGAGGLFDPASHEEINLVRRDRDLGQTLGGYGIGQGFFINWPVLGPSSPRDTVGTVGDLFLHPLTYLDPWYATAAVRGYEKVNETSFRIGDYESLKEAAIDPYVAIRDAYVQYRLNLVEKAGPGK